MTWQRLGGAVSRHRELALALAFVGMAAWELTEFLVLEGPHVTHVRLTLALHSVQVLLVIAVTWVVIRAWQERTRHQDALTRMVEKVVVAQEEATVKKYVQRILEKLDVSDRTQAAVEGVRRGLLG
jgi:hypothetical protein